MLIAKAIVRTERSIFKRLGKTNFNRSNDRLDYRNREDEKNGVSPQVISGLVLIVKAIVRVIVRTIKRQTITTWMRSIVGGVALSATSVERSECRANVRFCGETVRF